MAQQFIVPLYHLELVREKDIPYTGVTDEWAAADVFHQMLDSSPVEKLAVIHCNSGLDMIGAEVVAIGGVEVVGAAMADLFKGAIKNNAARIWIAHNHVDGRVTASMPDYRFTLKAIQVGQMLDIPIQDHLVVGPGAHYSIYKHRDELSRALISLERDEIKKKLMGMLPAGLMNGLPPLDPYRF
jgi:DNA repair protein RadC